ncbi:uncharacterized protein LOC132136861 [Carassius carassius]|uniref:uncharacterized protein LOC132136861 n=1 Tax=Carassius carassius TaxID=217509 RepID=UPI0028689D6C|nr:uncharacterized protein LOC132136861 [Carassius carassius]
MVGEQSRIMVRAFVVLCLCWRRLVGGTDEVTSVSVMEGESVSLNTGVTEVQKYRLIQWRFGETRIAQFNSLTRSSSTYDTDDDKTLKNRLNLDPQTGSLTITNSRTTDSGLYQLILTSRETRSKSFRVTVSATTTQSSSSAESSSSSRCVSSSCAVNNSTLKHTENLNTDCTHCCETCEAAIRLVVAAVVGVAAVAVLVYDIRSTRSEQHRRDSPLNPRSEIRPTV